MIWLMTSFAHAQLANEYDFKYTITFEAKTFEGEDIRQVVRDFREHIFADTQKKFNFQTRFDESGSMHIKTDYPLKQNQVAAFFNAHNKDFLTFDAARQKRQKQAQYAFSSSVGSQKK